jgi:IS30 family transposase
MGCYKRLTLQDREDIALYLSHGWSYQAIAEQLQRAVSTISREVARNSQGWAYRASLAAYRTRRRCHRQQRRLDSNPRLQAWVFQRLRWYWSPQQIARKLKDEFLDDPDMRLSHESLYTYLYVLPRGELRKELLRCLRQHHKARRKRSQGADRRGKITDMLSIEERPAEVADRCIPGHWESDLIMGANNQSALGTLVERSTRSLLLVRLKQKTATAVRRAFARKMKTLPQQMRLSMTHDQGIEMIEHKLFTKDTKIQVYFAHPHSPWGRGTNENTNGLLRQFFPKGTDFNEVSAYQIRRAQHLMNGRPRKVIGWKTPYEAMQELLR